MKVSLTLFLLSVCLACSLPTRSLTYFIGTWVSITHISVSLSLSQSFTHCLLFCTQLPESLSNRLLLFLSNLLILAFNTKNKCNTLQLYGRNYLGIRIFLSLSFFGSSPTSQFLSIFLSISDATLAQRGPMGSTSPNSSKGCPDDLSLARWNSSFCYFLNSRSQPVCGLFNFIKRIKIWPKVHFNFWN